jgi:hypothetical protein
MNFDWLEDYEKDEYNILYKNELNCIEINFLYVNVDNELYFLKSEKIPLEDGVLKKNDLIFILRKNMFLGKRKFSPSALLKFNIDLDPSEIKKYINSEDDYEFLTSEKYTNDIIWSDSIGMFHDLNSLHVIFKEKKPSNSTTKKIYIKKKGRRKRV